jgi:YidC/Oxa1 family membrane protein insertase
MEKRTILAIALSMLVFILFTWYQQKYTVRPVAKKPAPVEQTAPEPKEDITVPNQAEAQLPAPSTSDTVASGKTITVENELYQAVIDNKGAAISSWQLEKYTTKKDKIEEKFEMVATGQGEDYWRRPGSLIFKDPALTAVANKEFYQITSDSFEKMKAPATITMRLKRGDLEIDKRFEFDKNNYLMNLSVAAKIGGKPVECQLFLGQDIGPATEHENSTVQLEAVSYQGGKVKRESIPKNPDEKKKIEGDIRWVGLDMQYFTEIAILSKPLPYFQIQHIDQKSIDGKNVTRALLRLTTPMDGEMNCQFYMGQKNKSDLEAVKSADITGVINYGMFSVIVKPLLYALTWINQYIHNFGFSIILLTFLLTLILFPMRLKQMHSMKRMQAAAPEIKAIQEKYKKRKTDPKARADMNAETMAIYKKYGANPVSGCLPLLLQFPILIAFYSMLQYSIELRHAPFIGYIQDLAAKDPFYILPIVMGITMFISQKMTPMAPGTDPMMSKMMLVMPVVLTFVFKDLSSGLNLYFLCSNIFQIAFQKIAERWPGDRKAGAKSKA